METSWDFIISTETYQEGYALTEGDSIVKMISGIENTPQEIIPVLYWWVANYSHFLLTKPVMERIGKREIIETALHSVSTSCDPKIILVCFIYWTGSPH